MADRQRLKKPVTPANVRAVGNFPRLITAGVLECIAEQMEADAARIATLEAALRPFWHYDVSPTADGYLPIEVMVGDIRKARAALATTPTKEAP